MERVQGPESRWAWVEVNLAALRRNTSAFRRLLGRGVEMMCVVKADAYGHGAVPCIKTMHAAGASQFAVATVREGVALRERAHDEALGRPGDVADEDERVAPVPDGGVEGRVLRGKVHDLGAQAPPDVLVDHGARVVLEADRSEHGIVREVVEREDVLAGKRVARGDEHVGGDGAERAARHVVRLERPHGDEGVLAP